MLCLVYLSAPCHPPAARGPRRRCAGLSICPTHLPHVDHVGDALVYLSAPTHLPHVDHDGDALQSAPVLDERRHDGRRTKEHIGVHQCHA
jgi:hypothetical protein